MKVHIEIDMEPKELSALMARPQRRKKRNGIRVKVDEKSINQAVLSAIGDMRTKFERSS